MSKLLPDSFVKITLITSIWVNISEVFRYFVIVMPEMRRNLVGVPNVAPMDWQVFSIWGIWDTILTASIAFVSWLCYATFGYSRKSVMIAGLTSWATFFILFWIGMVNMNLAKPMTLTYVLPLCLLETVVAASIAMTLISKYASESVQ